MDTVICKTCAGSGEYETIYDDDVIIRSTCCVCSGSGQDSLFKRIPTTIDHKKAISAAVKAVREFWLSQQKIPRGRPSKQKKLD